MNNWTLYATYTTSSTTIRTLPTSFSELYIKPSSTKNYQYCLSMLIPQICIPDVGSVNQALELVQPGGKGYFSVCKIWANNLIFYTARSMSFPSYSYDVYYR